MKQYIKILFLALLTLSVAIFFYDVYALFAWRAMEKRYVELWQNIDSESISYASDFNSLKISYYEKRALAGKYRTDIYIYPPLICYFPETDTKITADELAKVKLYNADCKAKWVPESIVRPEVDELFKTWANVRKPMDDERRDINARIYADDSGKGKVDLKIINILAIVAGIGVLMSIIVLFILSRMPDATLPHDKKTKAE